MSSRGLLVASLVTLCVAGTVGQQQTQPTPTFRTEANFVRVDVFATQRGAPVRDLKLEDFHVLEDGVPQKLSSFEYVQVRTGTPQELRQEPNTIQQSRDELKNPRARVFVLFLDKGQVSVEGAWHAREPLVRLLDRLMGPEDLIGLMTPEMAPSDIVFARKTDVVTSGLRDKWPWGERHTLERDDIEKLFELCYPWPATQEVVREMRLRKRERMTLEALDALVTWLRDEREERKAILTLSEGWLLYRPNASLTVPRVIDPVSGAKEPIPGPDPIGTGPDGRIHLRPQEVGPNGGSSNDCHASRLALSLLDNDRYFRDLIDRANRANASFYTIDPRGLPVFDYPIGPDPPPGVIADSRHLLSRQDSLRILADNTDGMAVLNNNNLEPGLRRISDDLTSYYLLGYYSSNARLDGRFRKLTVKVTRPGVDIRARRGYKAATAEEVASAKRAAVEVSVPEAVANARAALGGLARLRPDARLYAHAVAMKGDVPRLWVAAELPRGTTAATTAVVTVTIDGASTTTDVPLVAGQRSFMAPIAIKAPTKGSIDVRVRVTPAGQVPFTDAVRVDAVTGLPMPMMFRRGPSTGNRYEPAGAPQFTRTERARFDVLKLGSAPLTAARVINREGETMEVPVTLGAHDEWLSAEVTLAALGLGDYLVEMTVGSQKVLAPFRVAR
jgi:VWFA-related protein